MSKTIHLKRGLDIAISGSAAKETGSMRYPDVFAIVPDHFAGITPKLMVKEGEAVKAGQPVFHDKQYAEMCFVSPVSGKVLVVNRGERRKVMSITIEADAVNQYEHFDADLNQMTGEEIKALLHKYNVSCLTELEGHPELFAAIMKDAEVIGDA